MPGQQIQRHRQSDTGEVGNQVSQFSRPVTGERLQSFDYQTIGKQQHHQDDELQTIAS